jgi:hypothetical protein
MITMAHLAKRRSSIFKADMRASTRESGTGDTNALHLATRSNTDVIFFPAEDNRDDNLLMRPHVFDSAMGKRSLCVWCPSCRRVSTTVIHKHFTTTGWVLFALLTPLCLCGWILFNCSCLFYYSHFCKKCKSFVGGHAMQRQIDCVGM